MSTTASRAWTRIRGHCPAPSTIAASPTSALPTIRRRANRAALDGQLTAEPSWHAGALGECDHDGEVVAGDEAQFVEGAVLFRGGARLRFAVLEETGGGVVEIAWLAEDVAGVDRAEVFLREAAARR